MAGSDAVAGGAGKPSKVELLKEASQFLKGTLGEDIVAAGPSISEDASTILKFHGSYQQDDRDLRTQRKREGLEKAFEFMVRVRIPGGRVTAAQYLACDRLATTVGNQTLRITTRQELQLHGVGKEDMKPTIRAINEALLCTLAACGDVERNVLSCPAPIHDGIREEMIEDCRRFVGHFAPRSTAYWDIWLDGEKIEIPEIPAGEPALVPTPGDDPVEPIYGRRYMPRKFKTAFALPEDNCTDVHANDMGYLAVVEDGHIVGYNVLVGGGLGTTPSAAKTFPAIAEPLTYVAREDLLRVGEAVIKVTRDFCNRSDRKRARLKYLLYDWGMAAFKAKVEEYLGHALPEPRPVRVHEVEDHLGWHEQGDGRVWLGLPIDNGRIQDEGGPRLLSGLRAFFKKYQTPARFTCGQSLLLVDLDPAWKPEIEGWLEEYGIATVERVATVRRWAMACPAFPTCGLAVTESERVMPTLVAELESELARLGLADERFTVRMTGCPNGCARPYIADIGLVGRSATKGGDGANLAGTYTIFLGGSTLGTRLNTIYKDYVPFAEVASVLRPVFERFRDERLAGEGFGDYCHRAGIVTAENDDDEAAEAQAERSAPV